MDAMQSESVRAEHAPREHATKVKRTYGRKKETANAILDTLSDTVLSAQTRPGSAVGCSVLEGSTLTTPVFVDASDVFGWRKKLAEIDEKFDDDAHVPDKCDAKHIHPCGLQDSSFDKSISTEGDSLSTHNDSLLSGAILPLTSSQTDPPSPGLARSKHSKKHIVADSDDSDGEGMDQVRQSSPASPQLPHPISTPKTRSSTTPPSSDVENDRRPSTRKSPATVRSSSEERCGAEDVRSRTKPQGKAKENPNKIKKLSKKEEKESKKAHARIIADQKISVTKRAEQFTINDLLGKLQHTQRPIHIAKAHATSSDPIQEFPSSPMLNPVDVSADPQPKAGPSGLQDNLDDEMPDMHNILKKQTEKRLKEEADAQRMKSLALAKRRALEEKAREANQTDTDDDDLEVVEGSIHVDFKPKRSKMATDYEKRLAGVAGFHVCAARHTFPGGLEGSQGEMVLKLAAKSAFGDRRARRATAVDHRRLQSAMLSKASKQSMQLTKEKEDEWVRRGGKLSNNQRAASVKEPFFLGRLAGELTLRKSKAERDSLQGEAANTGSGSDDSSDEDWQAENRGFTSPMGGRGAKESEEESEGTEGNSSGEEPHDENVPVTQQSFDTDEEDEAGHRKRTSRRTANRLVVSDSEEEVGAHHPRGRVLVPDTSMVFDDLGYRDSISSASESAADEENKENDTRLLFDSGDDKENHVVSHPNSAGRPGGLGGRQPRSLFNLEERARQMSMSPHVDAENIDTRKERKPLQARKMDDPDDLFVLCPSIVGESPKSSRATSTATSPELLQPAFGGLRGRSSQIFDDESIAIADENANLKDFLQPAFRFQASQKEPDCPLQPSFEPRPVKLGSLSDIFSPESQRPRFLKYMKRSGNNEFSLTLDTQLQPALEVATQVRRKADAIFEKEQDFILEEANSVRSRGKQELYITDSGLLTQTKPEGCTPIVYRSWMPSQNPALLTSQATDPPPTTQRLPLSTLSFMSETTSPSQHRLSRLVKGKGRAQSPVDGGNLLAFGPMPAPFTELLQAAHKQKRAEKRKLAKSEFVEGEAQESDEDELFGFGVTSKKYDDEESDDDDPDAVVEGLVDDAAMNVEQLAEEKVLEKVKEQIEQDDAALQKYHQAAVEGKYRGKRRGGGIAMDDSDSNEDEDEEARRLRRRMHKKRRIIDGDSLETLSKDEKSRAFYEAYQRDVQDDDVADDFAHLAKDDMNAADEEDENEQPETISTSEIQAKLREAARQQKGEAKQDHVFDPEDVDWAQPATLSDEEFEVKEVDDRPKRPAPRRPVFGQVDTMDFDDLLPRRSNNWSDTQTAQLAAWKKEQCGRNLGTGGARGAITVTGHGSKGTVRAGASMSRMSRHAASDEQSERRKPVKTASMLASVSDKHSRFGQ